MRAFHWDASLPEDRRDNSQDKLPLFEITSIQVLIIDENCQQMFEPMFNKQPWGQTGHFCGYKLFGQINQV